MSVNKYIWILGILIILSVFVFSVSVNTVTINSENGLNSTNSTFNITHTCTDCGNGNLSFWEGNDKGVILAYSFDANSTLVAIDLTGKYNATKWGTSSTADWVENGILNLTTTSRMWAIKNETNSSLLNSSLLSNGFSIEVQSCLYTIASINNAGIFSKYSLSENNRSLTLFYSGTNTEIRFTTTPTGATVTGNNVNVAIQNNSCQHIIATYGTTNNTLYINGIKNASTDRDSDGLLDTQVPFGVNCWYANFTNPQLTSCLNGSIDYVILYNYTLSDAEALDHYNGYTEKNVKQKLINGTDNTTYTANVCSANATAYSCLSASVFINASWSPDTQKPASLNCINCSDCNSAIAFADAGDTINLTQNIQINYTDCINFNGKNNIIFDCNWKSIEGDGDNGNSGIVLGQSELPAQNITIKDCNISYFTYGIVIDNHAPSIKDNNIFTNITLSNNQRGILNYYSSNNIYSQITSYENYYGILLFHSSNVSFNNITSFSDDYGIYLDTSDNNSISQINAQEDRYGITLSDSNGTIISNIAITHSLNGDASFLLLNSYYSVLNNITLSNNSEHGLDIGISSNNIFNNIITNENLYSGILLEYGSSYNNFTNVTSSRNQENGMFFTENANNNLILNSRIENNSQYGIYLRNANTDYNQFYNNTFNNTINIFLEDGIMNPNYFNTSIGNYYTNPTNNGYSDTCSCTITSGVCDSFYNLSNGTSMAYDYFPITFKTVTVQPSGGGGLIPTKPSDNYPIISDVNLYLTCTSGIAITINNLTKCAKCNTGTLVKVSNFSYICLSCPNGMEIKGTQCVLQSAIEPKKDNTNMIIGASVLLLSFLAYSISRGGKKNGKINKQST